MNGMLCDLCGKTPRILRIDRHHAMARWTITASCCDQTESITIDAPPFAEGSSFIVWPVVKTRGAP